MRRVPIVVWALVAIVVAFLALAGPDTLFGVAIGVVALVILAALVLGAKSINARVVITPDVVESRDALRRTRRCDRRAVKGMVVAPRPGAFFGASLQQVLLVDADGETRLSLAWDSYSDAQLETIRTALRLPGRKS